MRAGLVADAPIACSTPATGLVVAGGGSTFPAGADITEFSKPHVPPSFAEVMAAFEDAPPTKKQRPPKNARRPFPRSL